MVGMGGHARCSIICSWVNEQSPYGSHHPRALVLVTGSLPSPASPTTLLIGRMLNSANVSPPTLLLVMGSLALLPP